MKTRIRVYCVALIFFSALSISALGQNINWCATDYMNNTVLANNPQARQQQQQLKDFVNSYISNHSPDYFRTGSTASDTIMYVIPVVFHVIHNYGPENISDAQIYDEMQTLKINYQGLRTDTAAVYSAFKPIIADVQIEFRLAQLDPNGNCTNGIDRIASPLTDNADDNSKLNPWPYNQYLNIWTVNTWSPAVGNPGAYAYLPGVAPAGKDGIITLHNYVGSIGTATPANKWVLTHEAAHWLGVPHIWGTSNTAGAVCGDDGITDTPETKGNTTCPLPANAAICNPPIVENYQNYMDYSPCKFMFTNGQKARMWATLNSPVSLRNQVPTLTNLAATGTDGGTYVCTPVAFFNNRTVKYICEGAGVQFTDQSLNLDTTGITYSWFSSGASPATVTGKQATLTFPIAGVYDVSLTVSNTAGTDTYTAVGYVVVSPNAPGSPAPVVEGFETIAIPGAAEWFMQNEASTSGTFETTALTAFSGNNSLHLENYTGNASGTTDAIITPSFSLANTTAAGAFFHVAYANKTNGSTDRLRIYASTDCGASWVLRYTRTASQLATVSGLVSTDFIPFAGSTDTSQWRLDYVNLAPFSNQTNVRLKFEFTFDTGNNLYIDDINISGALGYEPLALDADAFSISPNPASGSTFINFTVLKSTDVTLTVTDILGKKTKTQLWKDLSTGTHRYELNIPKAEGIYFLQLNTGMQTVSRKLVLN